jgi:hypothetical protein
MRVDMAVLADTGEILRLRGLVNAEGNFEFGLFARRNLLIRKVHTHPDHYNPGGELIESPHKHAPTYAFRTGRWAYHVPDIPEEDFSEGLLAFLDECNISAIVQQRFG